MRQRSPLKYFSTVSLTTVVTLLSSGTSAAAPLEAQGASTRERDRGGCTMRDGPGDYAQNCITVTYTGNTVNKIKGYIQAAKIDTAQPTICNITVEMWGTLADGTSFRDSGPVESCSVVSLGGSSESVNKVFKAGSTICSRTSWDSKWSSPACVDAPG